MKKLIESVNEVIGEGIFSGDRVRMALFGKDQSSKQLLKKIKGMSTDELNDLWKDGKGFERAIKNSPQYIQGKLIQRELETRNVKENLSHESKIYDVLLSYDFDEWYEKQFKDHVVGEEKAPTKEEILKDIKKLFHV